MLVNLDDSDVLAYLAEIAQLENPLPPGHLGIYHAILAASEHLGIVSRPPGAQTQRLPYGEDTAMESSSSGWDSGQTTAANSRAPSRLGTPGLQYFEGGFLSSGTRGKESSGENFGELNGVAD